MINNYKFSLYDKKPSGLFIVNRQFITVKFYSVIYDKFYQNDKEQ